MGKFEKAVLKQLRSLHDLGFRSADAACGAGRAVMVARPQVAVCWYLFAQEDSGGASAWLWVAPPTFPDDGLENHRAGVKVMLGVEVSEESNEDFLRAIAARVRRYAPRLEALHDVVVLEARSPDTRRGQKYLEEVKLVVALLEEAASEGSSALAEAIDVLQKCIRARRSLRPADEAFARIAPQMRSVLRATGAFLSDDDEVLAGGLVEDLYIHLLTSPAEPLHAARELAGLLGIPGPEADPR